MVPLCECCCRCGERDIFFLHLAYTTAVRLTVCRTSSGVGVVGVVAVGVFVGAFNQNVDYTFVWL